ncbi:hypothetical protein F4V91_28760 [Neorhizobium galegae]|uniref:IstB-like ATP-binding domain-containing protein n=1 Tax=Neorhizobium galegae TaxID=399 RepID=A0A6A1TKV0_NEOGA|nr:hypothetical protein F4V91_28760 [Neorhizobium galegae]
MRRLRRGVDNDGLRCPRRIKTDTDRIWTCIGIVARDSPWYAIHRASPRKVRFLLDHRTGQRAQAGEGRGMAVQITEALIRLDLLILDELGYLPFSASGGALLFHLLSKLYERTSVVIATDLSFSEWASVFGEPSITDCPLSPG